MAVTHAFVSAKSDGGDATVVRPSNWNADHTIAGTLAWDGATVTADTPLLNLTQTWNNSGVTFTGVKVNITNTASGGSSSLLDIQIGGASQLKLDKFGYLYTQNISNAGNIAAASYVTAPAFNFSGGGVLEGSAAYTVEQRSGTNAQIFRVYNTYTDSSNYERGVFDWTTTANRLTIGTQEAGSGTPRAIDIKAVDGAGPNGYSGAYGLILSSGAGGGDYLGINAGAGVDISASVGGLMAGLQVRFAGSQLLVGPNPIQFGSAVGLVDVGLRRSAADVLSIDSGSAGSYRDLRVRDIIHVPSASLTPANNGELVIQATSNTSLTFKYKGSDGTVRSASLTLT